MSSRFILNDHPEIAGRHALFSPSQSSWLNYDEEKVIDRVRSQYRTSLGTEIHEYAAHEITLYHKKRNARDISQGIESYIYQKYEHLEAIEYGMTLIKHLGYIPKEVFETVKYYINDAVSYGMDVEKGLKYSDKIFGHADAIIFDEKNKLLRIHDLKTGFHEAKIDQLIVYAALFCLEYAIKPSDIRVELRIYQWDGINELKPTVEDILHIMDAILTKDKIASSVEKETR